MREPGGVDARGKVAFVDEHRRARQRQVEDRLDASAPEERPQLSPSSMQHATCTQTRVHARTLCMRCRGVRVRGDRDRRWPTARPMGRCRGCQGAQDPPAATATRYAMGQRLRPPTRRTVRAEHTECGQNTLRARARTCSGHSTYAKVKVSFHVRRRYSQGDDGKALQQPWHTVGQRGERTLQGTAEWPGLAWRAPARRRAAQPSCAQIGGRAAPAMQRGDAVRRCRPLRSAASQRVPLTTAGSDAPRTHHTLPNGTARTGRAVQHSLTLKRPWACSPSY